MTPTALQDYLAIPWHERHLFYGPFNAGKTAMGVSGFWDYQARQPIAKGRLMTFGGEFNDALGVPPEMVKVFQSPDVKSRKWLDDLDAYTMKLVVDAQADKLDLDVVAFDGLSEFASLYEAVEEDGHGTETFELFDGLRSQLYAIFSRLDPRVLGCDVLMTARVQEKVAAKASRTPGKTIPGDPDYMTCKHYPQMDGQMRRKMPHYFQGVWYMEKAMVQVKGQSKRVSRHLLHTAYQSDYFIKNQYEHLGLLPSPLHNPTWPQFKLALHALKQGQRVEEVTEGE